MDETKKSVPMSGKQNNMPGSMDMHDHGHDHGPWCYGWQGGHMHGRFGFGFWIAKLLFMVAMLLFVFWLGVKIGEIKSFYHYGPGRGDSVFFQKKTQDEQGMMNNIQSGTMPQNFYYKNSPIQ